MEHRIVRLAVPGRAACTVLVDGDGAIPSFPLSFEEGDTTVGAIVRTLLPELGLQGPILDFYIDQSRGIAPGDPVPVFVSLAEPADGQPFPAGWCEIALDDRSFGIEDALESQLVQWADVRCGRGVDDPLRAAWTRPGWHAQASAWIRTALADAGLPAPTAILQHRHWGISAVMRVETEAGRYWFKAVFDHFRSEASITRFLSQAAPGAVPAVIATNPDEGWMLLADLGPDVIAPDETGHSAAFAALFDFQARFAGQLDELVAAGCPRRPLRSLPADVDRVLADPIAREWLPVDDERAELVVAWLADAVASVETLGIPDLLVHGDFHPGNVAVSGDRRMLFDWSDAAISKPFVDVVTWSTWLEHDPLERDALWLSFAETWSGVLPANTWLELRPTFEGIAGGYHTVSYAGIVANLEPLRRPEHAVGLATFFGVLDAAVPR